MMAVCLVLLAVVPLAHAQEARPFLSNLEVTADDPLFATYAAPLERSQFIIDEGYRFIFYEDEAPLRMDTDHAGDWYLAFRRDGDVRRTPAEMASEPVVTASYSDLVRYHYRPYDDVRADVHFQVYSSGIALKDVTLTNTGDAPVRLDVTTVIDHPGGLRDVELGKEQITFDHTEPLDGWMERRQKEVPYVPERQNVLLASEPALAAGVVGDPEALDALIAGDELDPDVVVDTARAVALMHRYDLAPGQTRHLRVVRGVIGEHDSLAVLAEESRELIDYDVDQGLRDAEQTYARIPELTDATPDERLMYWSAFSLIRQCMLPPEGKSSYNYYVFSREPTWGWGYAGQVFHESLVMLAYAFMDPESARNSQRVYMERQWENGYIYYRIGSYLEAMNFVRGDFTTSAPWYNWQNWEIYQVDPDRAFLEDAYASGVKFYNWWPEHRDADGDGLMEWGGHAVLESIRDARVAVWRDVGWPSNFEAPELNGMLVREAGALAKMAEALGKPDEAAAWRQEAEQRAERIRETFWDEETGFFYYVDRDDHDFTFDEPDDLKRQEIIGLFALWDGTASPEQAERLVEHMTDPDKFWRPYGIPSLAADDPFYRPQGYWNGPVWVELQYLLFRGLLDYGYEEEARELADRVFATVIHHLKEDHTFWEFYNPDELWGGHHQTYIWTGIVARMLIDLERAGAGETGKRGEAREKG